MKRYEDVDELCYEEVHQVKALFGATHPTTVFDPTEKVEQLMQGAIDFHCHCGPCAKIKRAFNEIEYGIEATKAGMGAIVSKATTAPTARCAILAQTVVDQWAGEHNMKSAKIVGGVSLSYCVGGLNAHAVRNAAQFGGRFVWTPIHDSAHHRRMEALAGMDSSGGIEVINENNEVLPELREVFQVIAEHDMVLSLAHHNTKERFAMLDAAREAGVRRISICHPLVALTKMSVDQMKIAADKGAYLEHVFGDLSPVVWPWDQVMESIKVVGADHIVLGTDVGRWTLPPPVPVYRIVLGRLLEMGVPESDVEKMARLNAEKLIWGEP